MRLSRLSRGGRGRIVGFDETVIPHMTRYLSLGLIPGSVITVLTVAPMGCPLQIKVGSTYLSIRRVEAEDIIVEGIE